MWDFQGKIDFFGFFVKNMLTGIGKDDILSELLRANCFCEADNNNMFQKKQKSC